MTDHGKHSDAEHEEAARALSWKLFLIVCGAVALFSGAVILFVL